jgi:peptidyl-dipeptidase A
MTAFSDVRDAHLARRVPRERQCHEAEWNLALTGDEEWERKSTEHATAIKEILSDRDVFEALKAARASGRSESAHERRELEILFLEHAANQADPKRLGELVKLEVRAEALYSSFRPELDGRRIGENDIRGILRDSDDRAHRRKAWEASKAIGPEVAPLVLDMARRRNDIARGAGYRDHFAMSLELQEIDEAFLFDTLERLEELTDEPHRALIDDLFGRVAKRLGISAKDVRPWDLGDPFFQEMIPDDHVSLARFYRDADLVRLTRDSFAASGFDVQEVIDRSDLFPREKKNQHAFCTMIDRDAFDVRVLCNVVPDDYWMDTMLHEFGHAVYDQGLDPKLPWLLRDVAHTLATESIALLFGRLASNPDWLVRFVGVPREEADRARPHLAAQQRAKQLLFPRWVLVMVFFERALYADPDQDLNTLWWDLVERFQRVPRHEGRNAPDWACKLHVALAPVYYQNYLLGDLMASQLDSHLQSTVAPRWFDDPRTSRVLMDGLFLHGAVRPWNEALTHLTGSPLDPAHYVDQFVTTRA